MKIKILSILLSAGLFFSCSDEIGNTHGQQQENETVTTTINLALAPINQITTRSASTSDEQGSGLLLTYNSAVQTKSVETEEEIERDNKVTDLWIVQYDQTTGEKLSQGYITDWEKVTNDKVTLYKVNVDFLVKNDNNNSFICFIANKGYSGTSWPNTLDEYKSLQHTYANEASVINGDKLIMTGVYTGPVPIDTNVQLERLAAKLALTIEYTEELDAQGFYIDKYQLIRVPTFGQYFNKSAASSLNEWIFPTRDEDNYNDYPLTEDNYINSGTRLVWYIPENRQGTNYQVTNEWYKTAINDPGYLETEISYATRIVLKGLHDNSNNITFTLFPGSNNTSDYNIIRNTYYDITAHISKLNSEDNRIVKYYDLTVIYYAEDAYGTDTYTIIEDWTEYYSNYGLVGTEIKLDNLHLLKGPLTYDSEPYKIEYNETISPNKEENVVRVYFKKSKILV